MAHVAKRRIDSYEGFSATAAKLDIRLTAGSFGLIQKTMRFSMERPGLCRGWCSELRFYPVCMSRGYHSLVHHFGGIHFCQMHDCCLENRCCCCGSSSEHLIKASLLDTPFKCPHCGGNYGNISARHHGRHWSKSLVGGRSPTS